jgi:hypothetical protein
VVTTVVYFSVLGSRTKTHAPVLVKHHADAEDAALQSPLSFLVQWLDVWTIRRVNHVECFEDSDPAWIPFDQLGSWGNLSTHLMHWASQPSDTDGCVDLLNPQLADSMLSLTDAACPSFKIFSELLMRGWKPVNAMVVHSSAAPAALDMDGRHQTLTRKVYYKTLLDLPKYWALCAIIPSDEPVLFYACLLKGIATVAGLGHKEYQRILKGLGGEDGFPALEDGADDFPALEDGADDDLVIAGGASSARAGGASRSSGAGGASSSGAAGASSSGGLGPAGPVVHPLAPIVAPLPDVARDPDPVSDSSDSLSSDDSSSASSGFVVAGRPHTEWIVLPGGGKLRLDDYVQKSGAKQKYKRWILSCPHHAKCEKKRSVSTNHMKAFGPLEPIAMLMVWRDLKPEGDRSHNSVVVSIDAVKAWVEQTPRFADEVGLVL